MKALQAKIRAFSLERGWLDGAVPANYAKSIAIEAAELLELFQWKHEAPERFAADPEALRSAGEELADVIIYCLNLAVILGLDAEEAVEAKMLANARKYPAEAMRADPESYYRIKRMYRERA